MRPRGAGSRTDRAGAYAAYLRGTFARLRDTAEARAIIDSVAAAVNAGAADLPLHPGALAGELAEYHAWLGDVERTLHWLARSAALSPVSQFIVTETATYARVRADPRFRAELERIRRGIRARVERATP